jgi:hypothetical protein
MLTNIFNDVKYAAHFDSNEANAKKLFNKLIEIICVGACGEKFKLFKFSMQVIKTINSFIQF